MSKPKLLDAYTKESKTIAAVNPEYSIVANWVDENVNIDNRLGLFVTRDIDKNKKGEKDIFINKATKTSKILGVTVKYPGFASNVSKEYCSNHDNLELHHSKAYVCFSGYASVMDNGLCKVGDTCKSNDDGTAIPSTSGGGFKVIYRLDDLHVLIHLDPLPQIDVVGNKLIINC